MDTSDLTTGLREQERISDVSNRKYEKFLLRVYFFTLLLTTYLMCSLSLAFSVRAITVCCLHYASLWNSGGISVLFIRLTEYTTRGGTRFVGNFITCNTYFDWERGFGI